MRTDWAVSSRLCPRTIQSTLDALAILFNDRLLRIPHGEQGEAEGGFFCSSSPSVMPINCLYEDTCISMPKSEPWLLAYSSDSERYPSIPSSTQRPISSIPLLSEYFFKICSVTVESFPPDRPIPIFFISIPELDIN